MSAAYSAFRRTFHERARARGLGAGAESLRRYSWEFLTGRFRQDRRGRPRKHRVDDGEGSPSRRDHRPSRPTRVVAVVGRPIDLGEAPPLVRRFLQGA
jgi:hypothetical protein